MTTHAALVSKAKALKVIVAFSFLGAVASALPVMRPWEYFNEVVGGGKNGYLYFDDEGVDLGQRTKEMAGYYREVLQPVGELPYENYMVTYTTEKARGLDWVGQDPKRDEARLTSPVWSGTILQDAKFMGKKLWWDDATLRAATPIARFGIFLVFRGTFALPGRQAAALYFAGIREIYLADTPNLELGERLLRESVEIDPTAFFANIELGNVCLRRATTPCTHTLLRCSIRPTTPFCGSPFRIKSSTY